MLHITLKAWKFLFYQHFRWKQCYRTSWTKDSMSMTAFLTGRRQIWRKLWKKHLRGRERVGSTEQCFGVRLQQLWVLSLIRAMCHCHQHRTRVAPHPPVLPYGSSWGTNIVCWVEGWVFILRVEKLYQKNTGQFARAPQSHTLVLYLSPEHTAQVKVWSLHSLAQPLHPSSLLL